VDTPFALFARDSRTFSKAEKEGWVKVFVSPLPFGSIERDDVTAVPSIRGLLDRSKESVAFPLNNPEIRITGSVPFNTAQTTAESVILKQVVAPQAAINSLSIELDRYGRAKLFAPIVCPGANNLLAQLQSHKVRDSLFQVGGGFGLLKPFDIGQIWLTTACLINFYLQWLGSESLLTRFHITSELDGVWRFVAFCDVDLWAGGWSGRR
jgi:hypothetical protein